MSKNFKKGDRVRMTPSAIANGLDCGNSLYPRSTTALVVNDQDGDLIDVIRDNRSTLEKYHVNYWRIDD